MATPLRFADAEALLVSAVAGVTGVNRVVTRLPAAERFNAALPVVRVQRFGGADDRLTDSPRVDVDSFAADYDAAAELARAVHTAVLALAHSAIDGTVIDTVETISGPIWVDYDDTNVMRFVASYELAIRALT